MADRQEIFNVTCPANTAATAPVERDMTFPPGKVESVTVRIAKGHASLTGIRLAYGHTVIIPRNSSAFVRGDDHTATFTPGDAGDSGQWSAFLMNTDNRSHFWSVTFEVNEIAQRLISPLPEPNFHDPAPFLDPEWIGSSVRYPTWAPDIPPYDARWTPGWPVGYAESVTS